MTLEQVREYERKQQEETNSKLKSDITCTGMLKLYQQYDYNINTLFTYIESTYKNIHIYLN